LRLLDILFLSLDELDDPHELTDEVVELVQLYHLREMQVIHDNLLILFYKNG
jgi:hypothetical protein